MAVHNKGGTGCTACGKYMWLGPGGRAFLQRVRMSEALSLPQLGMKPNPGSELHSCMTQVKPYTPCTLTY